jgi:hypothetical protein
VAMTTVVASDFVLPQAICLTGTDLGSQGSTSEIKRERLRQAGW